MKKLLIFLGIIVGIFVLLFAINEYSLRSKNDNIYGIPARDLNPLTLAQLDDPHYQNIILPKDLEQKLQNKESGFVYFFSPDCSHCKATTPFLMPMAQDVGADVKQFNLLEFRDGWNDYKIQYTPTLIYYKDGQEMDRIEGGFAMVNGKPDAATTKGFTDFFNKYTTK